jgi:hypothetical protein
MLGLPLLAIAALLVALGCQNILSIEGPIEVAGLGDACGLKVNGGSCQACVAQSCCDPAAACARDLPCATLEQCLFTCGGDYECRATCVAATHNHSSPPVVGFEQCLAAACEADCALSCGLPGSYGVPEAGAACQSCLFVHVCSSIDACMKSLPCSDVAHCAQNCRTLDCQQACLDSDDAGTGLLAPVVLGVASYCASDCNIGEHWDCLGYVGWPFPKATEMTVQLTVKDASNGQPVGRVHVDACTELACTVPVASATTDASGVASLPMPHLTSGTYGFRGYFQLSSPDIYPTLYFPAFPVSEPVAKLTINLATPAEWAGDVALAGAKTDPARGHISVTAYDCYLNRARGLVFSAAGIDAETQVRYLNGTQFDPSVTETDFTGLAIFVNVPTGATITLRATPLSTGTTSGTTQVFTRPGALSLVDLVPTP